MFERILKSIFLYNCLWELSDSTLLKLGARTKFDNKCFKKSTTNKLKIKSVRKVSKGWYLFIFRYSEPDQNLKISISNCVNFSFSQEMLISPNKRKFRIIRISRKENLNIVLYGLCDFITINNLEIFKIPIIFIPFIFKRDLKLNRLLSNSFLTLPKLWKQYNKKQSEKYPNLNNNYQIYLTEIEPIFFKKFLTRKKTNYKFVVKDHNNFSFVENSEFVLSFNPKFTELYEWAFSLISLALDTKKNSHILYGNEDFISENKKRYNPNFKTAWNEELFISDPLYSSLWIISGKIWNSSIKELISKNIKITYKSILFQAIQTLKKNGTKRPVHHIPHVLSAKNHLFDENWKNEEFTMHLSALRMYLEFNYSSKSFFILDKGIGLKLQWATNKNDKLSIIIPTKDNLYLLKSCLDSISNFATISNYEIILVNNKSREPQTIAYFKKFINESRELRVHRILDFNEEFNYSKINNFAVNQAHGSVVLLLNNDVEFLDFGWDIDLLTNAKRNEVGFVGTKLIYPDHTIQHCGILLGSDKVAYHPLRGLSEKEFSESTLDLAQEFSAVTGACMAITRKKWELLRGMDQENLKICFNDVDICLKAQSIGLRNIYLPYVRAIHHESKSRGRSRGKFYKQINSEKKILKKRWLNVIENDPYSKPANLLLRGKNTFIR